jgi:hypothetical protein
MFDAYPEKKEQEAKKTLRQVANGAVDASRAGGPNARKVTSMDEGKTAAAPQALTKDQIAMPVAMAPTATASATVTSSKKRKATAQPATNGAQAHTTAASAQSSTTTRRITNNAPTTVSPGLGFRETNMLSFERCGAKPKDGTLVADDGSVIAKNGKYDIIHA